MIVDSVATSPSLSVYLVPSLPLPPQLSIVLFTFSMVSHIYNALSVFMFSKCKCPDIVRMIACLNQLLTWPGHAIAPNAIYSKALSPCTRLSHISVYTYIHVHMPDCTDTVTYSKLSIVIWHDAIADALVKLLSPLALFLLPPLSLCADLPLSHTLYCSAVASTLVIFLCVSAYFVGARTNLSHVLSMSYKSAPISG